MLLLIEKNTNADIEKQKNWTFESVLSLFISQMYYVKAQEKCDKIFVYGLIEKCGSFFYLLSVCSDLLSVCSVIIRIFQRYIKKKSIKLINFSKKSSFYFLF